MKNFLPLLVSFLIDFSLVKSDLFDHAYRKLSEAKEELGYKKFNFNGDQLLRRIGIADGEEEEDEKEPLSESKFMRRFGSLGEEVEDQVAIESSGKFRKVPYSNNQAESSSRRMATDDDIDVSKIPMEHRAPGGFFSPMSRIGKDARNLMLSAANIVLTPDTVATYLAQMWITNIMQTVGWGLIASFFSTANGRSFKQKSSQRRSEGEREARTEDDEENILDSLDSKAVATILRGLADAADNWAHNEL